MPARKFGGITRSWSQVYDGKARNTAYPSWCLPTRLSSRWADSTRWCILFALGVEIPRASWGMWSIFPVWRAAYEHHTDFQQRISVGAVPTLRIDPHPLLATQVGLEVGGAYLRSLWTPYRFDAESGTWSRGESEMKLTWQFGAELTAWVNVAPALGVGVFYGITLLYPLAPENEVSIVPLTKLGLCMRWNYGA